MKINKFLSFLFIFISLISAASAENKYYDKYKFGVVSPSVQENSTIAVVIPDGF